MISSTFRFLTLIARICAFYSICFLSFQAQAADIAVGHHLWEITAPDKTKNYIAAALLGDPRTAPILKKQLDSASSVEQVVFSNSINTSFEPLGVWSKSINSELPKELKDKIVEIARSIIGDPEYSEEKVTNSSLFFARNFLYDSSVSAQIKANKQNGVVKEILLNFLKSKPASYDSGRPKALAYFSKEEAAKVFTGNDAQGLSPNKIIKEIIDDRDKNGPLADRVFNLFRDGNWGNTVFFT